MESVSVAHRKTLVLNRNFSPIDIIDSLEAVCKVYTGAAKILGSDWQKYDFTDWIENWEDIAEMSGYQVDTGRLVNGDFISPEIIVLEVYRGHHKPHSNFSRRNIFVRDENTCQYCSYHSSDRKKFNLDHVFAKSKGGKATWENIVLSCFPCNRKKVDMTLKEANMKLLRKPKKPVFNQPEWGFGSEKKVSIPKSWDDFVGSLYWNTTLKD